MDDNGKRRNEEDDVQQREEGEEGMGVRKTVARAGEDRSCCVSVRMETGREEDSRQSVTCCEVRYIVSFCERSVNRLVQKVMQLAYGRCLQETERGTEEVETCQLCGVGSQCQDAKCSRGATCGKP